MILISLYVYFSYHPLISEHIKDKFVSRDAVKACNRAIATHFMGTYFNKEQPLNLGRKGATFLKSMRQAPNQNLVHSDFHYNIRKLLEMPFHLTECYQYTELVKHCCRRFEWLRIFCSSLSLKVMIDQLSFALRKLPKAMMDLKDDDDQGRIELENAAEEVQRLKFILMSMIDQAMENPIYLASQVCLRI